MVVDLVIDTNVLVHASNCKYEKVDDCLKFIDWLKDSDELVCLDTGTDGHIYHEYLLHLPPGSYGFTLLLQLNDENRIRFIDRDIPAAVNTKINKTGIKKTDRIFVRIAYKTIHKILVSQEYEDFTIKNRAHFKKEIGVLILEAYEYNANIIMQKKAHNEEAEEV